MVVCNPCSDILNCTTAVYNATEGKHEYMSKIETNGRQLNNSRDKLHDRMEEIENLIQRGSARPKEETWLKHARSEEKVMNKFLGPRDRPHQLPETCFCNCCSCPCYIYRLGKQISETLDRVNKLLEECNDQPNDEKSNLRPGGDEKSNLITEVEMIGMDTKFDEFWGYFEDETAPFIRVHGMGGIGKSAFLMNINKKLLENNVHGYKVIIWVDLSEDQHKHKNIQTFQKKVGASLRLCLPEDSEERGEMIYNELKKLSFILLLDDVHFQLHFRDLRVPVHHKCKVVFTTREDGLWNYMNPKEVKLSLLQQEEAQLLFKREVGPHVLSPHSNLSAKADEVAHLCFGLPLALVTIGRAMSPKTELTDWDDIINQLQSSARATVPDRTQVFRRLKIGYNYLKHKSSHDCRSYSKCFLYCSLFPRGQPIAKEELIHYWIAEDFLSSHQTLTEARASGDSTINTAKRVCLLMCGEDESTIKMHHLIHGMASWLTSGDGADEDTEEKFFVRSGVTLDVLPQEENWAEVKRISLVKAIIKELKRIKCSNLSTLIVKHCHVTRISSDFFDSMKKLKVLDLSWSIVPDFPKGIVNLTTLQYLNLSRTKISKLPADFKKLKKLKLLDLSFMEWLHEIPANVLSKLKELQFLNMYYCGFGDQRYEGFISVAVGKDWMDELKQLRNLEELGVTIKGDHAFQQLENLPKLSCVHSILITKCKGTLQLSSIKSATRLKALHVINCVELATIQLEPVTTVNDCFKSLCDVEISNCKVLKDLTWIRYAQALQRLKVSDCMQLKKVINDQSSNGATEEIQQDPIMLSNLRNLHLNKLPDLDSIYVQALPFNSLEEITVLYCPKLKRVPLDASNIRASLSIKCQEKWWEDLEDDAIKRKLCPDFV